MTKFLDIEKLYENPRKKWVGRGASRGKKWAVKYLIRKVNDFTYAVCYAGVEDILLHRNGRVELTDTAAMLSSVGRIRTLVHKFIGGSAYAIDPRGYWWEPALGPDSYRIPTSGGDYVDVDTGHLEAFHDRMNLIRRRMAPLPTESGSDGGTG